MAPLLLAITNHKTEIYMKKSSKSQTLFLLFTLILFKGMSQENTADCLGALVLCEKKDFIVKTLHGIGGQPYEIGFSSCSKNLVERNTIWIKWVVDSPGDIGFTITPLKADDDIDFIVYKNYGHLWSCNDKRELRCMAAGIEIGKIDTAALPCFGKTGLKLNGDDIFEKDGCDELQDNFLSSFYAHHGDSYILYINNYTSDSGFKISWSGNATFLNVVDRPLMHSISYSKSIYFKSDKIDKNYIWKDAALEKALVAPLDSMRPFVYTFIGCGKSLDALQYDKNAEFSIGLPYPNPGVNNFFIQLSSPVCASLDLYIYNSLGCLVKYREMIIDKGEQVLNVPTQNLTPGMYFATFQIAGFRTTRKILINN